MDAHLAAATPSPQQQQPFDWPKLDSPAMVSGAVFHQGVSTKLVIDAAKRHYEMGDRTPTAESIEKFAELITQQQQADHSEDVLNMVQALERLSSMLVTAMEWSSYQTEYDGQMYDICNSCGGKDGQHRQGCELPDMEKALDEAKALANYRARKGEQG